MAINQIFNPNGNDDINTRTMWFGETTNLMQLNDVRYNWAVNLYEQMRGNFWIPQKYDLTSDVTDYVNLTPDERRAFDGILSYLTFLDSIQTCNLPHLKGFISAPEVGLCIAEQISQEAMHNQSYQYIIESIIPSDRRIEVYEFWRTDNVLRSRCEYIASYYQIFLNYQSQENYFAALFANYLLEGIYFFNGFAYFYNLSSRMLMSGCADIFKAINRDELSHVRLFQKMLTEAMTIFPFDPQELYAMTASAVRYEIDWSQHIIGDNILGITSESTEAYTKYRANTILKAIGLNELYPGIKNPYKHLEKFADIGKDGNTKSNFFEAGVTSYSMSSGVTGWADV